MVVQKRWMNSVKGFWIHNPHDLSVQNESMIMVDHLFKGNILHVKDSYRHVTLLASLLHTHTTSHTQL